MKLQLLAISVLSTITLTACAEEKMDHSKHMMHQEKTAAQMPTEAGQGGFAAIAEIVKILSDNPKTDWSKVNITALREHLLDMNRLVMGAKVREHVLENGVRFDVTGNDDVLKAIQNMVPAHSKELNKMQVYTVITKPIENGTSMVVTTNNKDTLIKIKGLGFFGLMATGSHHQPHHFMMATGNTMHH